MSDDPETLRQIRELAADDRPLLVLDVDEVVLEFVRPFMSFLEMHGLEHKLTSFRLHGNILDRENGLAIEDERVTRLIDDFFAAQHDWQTVADGGIVEIGVRHGGESRGDSAAWRQRRKSADIMIRSARAARRGRRAAVIPSFRA